MSIHEKRKFVEWCFTHYLSYRGPYGEELLKSDACVEVLCLFYENKRGWTLDKYLNLEEYQKLSEDENMKLCLHFASRNYLHDEESCEFYRYVFENTKSKNRSYSSEALSGWAKYLKCQPSNSCNKIDELVKQGINLDLYDAVLKISKFHSPSEETIDYLIKNRKSNPQELIKNVWHYFDEEGNIKMFLKYEDQELFDTYISDFYDAKEEEEIAQIIDISKDLFQSHVQSNNHSRIEILKTILFCRKDLYPHVPSEIFDIILEYF